MGRNLKGLVTHNIDVILSMLLAQSHTITIIAHKSKMSKVVYEETFPKGEFYFGEKLGIISKKLTQTFHIRPYIIWHGNNAPLK